MADPRVKRSKGPIGKVTENTYRKKALPFLQKDFDSRCAYCLRDLTEEHLNQSHIEHFDCTLSGRRRNQYKNLMLACSACNLSKHHKRAFDPMDPERRLLNCTTENEFPNHIVEDEQCAWRAMTAAGDYHIVAADLNERSHIKRRLRRKLIYEHLSKLESSAIRYSGSLLPECLKEMQESIDVLRRQLNRCVPFPKDSGLFRKRHAKRLLTIISSETL